jgi:hypothetical protein
MPLVTDYSGDMSLSEFSNTLQQANAQADTAPGLQASDTDQFSTNAQNFGFWNDPQYLPTLYQGPYADFDFVFSIEDAQNAQMEMSLCEPELGQNVGSPPVPSFLDARSSPEPLEGQGLRFDDYIRQTFGNRRHIRIQAGKNQGRGLRTSADGLEKAHVPPLMGDFPSVLSSKEGATLWEPENLAHVRSLPQLVYDQIAAMYEKLNVTNGQYTQFASGAFPSLAACNAFIQLFFEEFNQLFPLLHQPTFDPASEPWLLVLAVTATGCRFSRVSAAVESGDLMQEFLRRAFFATVREFPFQLRTCVPIGRK